MDTWHRIRGMRQLGVTLLVVLWNEGTGRDAETEEAVNALEGLGASVHVFERHRHFIRALHPRYPPRAVSFIPSGAGYHDLVQRMRRISAAWLLLDGWAGYLVARKLCAESDLPLVYRSHNCEASYYSQLVAGARGVERWRLRLTSARMTRIERELRLGADLVLDIATADTELCASYGYAGKAEVLPPTFLGPFDPVPYAKELRWDVLFGGSLWSVHNVNGVRWFADSVVPELERQRTKPLRICLAGSHPTPDVVDLCRARGFDLIPNPPSLEGCYAQARILVNPVQHSSGVNLKTISMLASGRPVISCSSGLRGLPPAVRAMATEAPTAMQFASAVLGLLRNGAPTVDTSRAALLEENFGLPALARAHALVDRIVGPT